MLHFNVQLHSYAIGVVLPLHELVFEIGSCQFCVKIDVRNNNACGWPFV